MEQKNRKMIKLVEELEKKIAHLSSQNQELTTDNKRLKKKVRGLCSTKDTVEEEYAQLRNTVDSLKSKLHEEQVKSKKNKKTAKSKTTKKMEEAFGALKTEYKALLKKSHTLDSENQGLRRKVTKYEKMLKRFDSKIKNIDHLERKVECLISMSKAECPGSSSKYSNKDYKGELEGEIMRLMNQTRRKSALKRGRSKGSQAQAWRSQPAQRDSKLPEELVRDRLNRENIRLTLRNNELTAECSDLKQVVKELESKLEMLLQAENNPKSKSQSLKSSMIPKRFQKGKTQESDGGGKSVGKGSFNHGNMAKMSQLLTPGHLGGDRKNSHFMDERSDLASEYTNNMKQSLSKDNMRLRGKVKEYEMKINELKSLFGEIKEERLQLVQNIEELERELFEREEQLNAVLRDKVVLESIVKDFNQKLSSLRGSSEK